MYVAYTVTPNYLGTIAEVEKMINYLEFINDHMLLILYIFVEIILSFRLSV